LLDASGLGACSLPPEDTCAMDAQCGNDLVCGGSQCRTMCATDAQCGSGGTCSNGSCIVPVSGAPDAGVRDAAGTSDAGPGTRPSSGTGAPCAAGVCPSGYDCATAAENTSVAVCRRPCAHDVDCASEGVGSYCYALHCTTPCDPVANAGCGSEVCGVYTGNPPSPEPMVDFTDCHPAGAIGVDGTGCTNEIDCAAGTTCMNGTCRRTCHYSPAAAGDCTRAGFACFPGAPFVNTLTQPYGACCPDPMGC
jgi:hypothetical protein